MRSTRLDRRGPGWVLPSSGASSTTMGSWGLPSMSEVAEKKAESRGRPLRPARHSKSGLRERRPQVQGAQGAQPVGQRLHRIIVSQRARTRGHNPPKMDEFREPKTSLPGMNRAPIPIVKPAPPIPPSPT
jgi:hypothetical protein